MAPLLLYTHHETGELFSRRWRLFVVEGADRGTSTDIVDTPALIGAAPASALVLGDDTVSRYHAEIDVFAEGLRVRDLDSTNGTFLGQAPASGVNDDERIRDAFVENGSVFRVGRTAIRLIAIDEPAASEIETDPHGAPPGATEHFGGLVGVAASTRELFRVVRKVAPSSSAVLLEGEVGTGKALLAEQIHARSPRAESPFVAVDLSTLSDDAMSNALFGLAVDDEPPRLGLFERANHGTLFIEHVDLLPAALQQRIRDVMERGELRRNGDRRTRRIDVRCISSSEVRLENRSDFDRGLYRRLAVVRLKVPPLRARLDDAPAIVAHILGRSGRGDVKLGSRTRGLLDTQRYPLNTRDAERFAELLETPSREVRSGFDGVLVKAHLDDVLEAHRGHVGRAAERLGFSTPALFRMLHVYRVDLDAL